MATSQCESKFDVTTLRSLAHVTSRNQSYASRRYPLEVLPMRVQQQTSNRFQIGAVLDEPWIMYYELDRVSLVFEL
jgi:hypothetical protein